MNSTVRGIVYVSVCVVVWGTVASLMDWMLLVEEVYTEGTSGQLFTVHRVWAATVVLATRFSSRFLGRHQC
jgi:TM2 domain-containing membrane protein YozV